MREYPTLSPILDVYCSFISPVRRAFIGRKKAIKSSLVASIAFLMDPPLLIKPLGRPGLETAGWCRVL